MTEQTRRERKRQALLVARCFAEVFLTSADAELRGAPEDDRIAAQEALEAALFRLSRPMTPLEDILALRHDVSRIKRAHQLMLEECAASERRMEREP
jgi:hypothetical protein